MDPIDKTFLMAEVAEIVGPFKPYQNPNHVEDGPYELINQSNKLSRLIREATVPEIIHAARHIAAAASAGRRHLKRLAPGVWDCPLDDEPDADFKLWCEATEAWLRIKGRGNGRFRGSPGHRSNFAKRYLNGMSGIDAYNDLYAELTAQSCAVRKI